MIRINKSTSFFIWVSTISVQAACALPPAQSNAEPNPLPLLTKIARKVAVIKDLDRSSPSNYLECIWNGNYAVVVFPMTVPWPLRHELLQITLATGKLTKLDAFNRTWKRRNDSFHDFDSNGRRVGDAQFSLDGRSIWWRALRPGNGGPVAELFEIISIDGKQVIPGATISPTRLYSTFLPHLNSSEYGFQSAAAWLRDSRELVSIGGSVHETVFLISVDAGKSQEFDLPDDLRSSPHRKYYWSILGQRPNGRVLITSGSEDDKLLILGEFSIPPAQDKPRVWTVQVPGSVLSYDVQLSPGGDRLLWTAMINGEDSKTDLSDANLDYRKKSRTELWISKADGSGIRPLGWMPRPSIRDESFGTELWNNVNISPDGKHVCFSYVDGIYVLDVPEAALPSRMP